jgi:hypothetical protein
MKDPSEGCNCTCHDKGFILCSKCKGEHKELREQLIPEYQTMQGDRTDKARGDVL